VAEQTFADLFNEMESGSFTSSIPAGSYDVVVAEARPEQQKLNVIFLTLKVLDGPAAGKTTEVNIYIPMLDGTDKPFTLRKFKEKLFGFLAYPDVKSAGQSLDNAPSRLAALDLLAGSLVGKNVKAEIGLRGADAGTYANTNELTASLPAAGGSTVASAAPVTVTEPVADNGAQAVANVASPF
jgi:hypothetical protein